MQQHKSVEDYLNSVIPQKISEKTKTELREELECHIYDRAEFYMEIGYDEETAVGKAVEQMGEAESVRKSFNALYRDSAFKAVLLFVGICAWNLFSIVHEFGYMYFVDPTIFVLPNVVMLGVFLAVFTALTVYTIKCIRERLDKQTMGIVWAFVLITLGSFVTSGIFFPIINAGKLIFRYITNGPASEIDWDIVIANIVLLVLYTTIIFAFYDKRKLFREKTYRLSLRQITAILSVSCLCFLTVYGFAYAKYESWYSNDWVKEEMAEEEYISNNIAEPKDAYDSIQIGDGESETQKDLEKKGFVKKNNSYSENLRDAYLPWYIDAYLTEKIEENDIGRVSEEYVSVYYYTNGMEDEGEYDDIISCIVVAYDYEGRITYKLFMPDMNFDLIEYMNYTHGEEAQIWFDGLKKGDDGETAMAFIRKTNSFIIEDEKYEGENSVKTYRILLNCFYPIEPDFTNWILGDWDLVNYSYDFEITVQNGVISSYKMCDD